MLVDFYVMKFIIRPCVKCSVVVDRVFSTVFFSSDDDIESPAKTCQSHRRESNDLVLLRVASVLTLRLLYLVSP